MGLINCPECGREISDRAASCPACACPVSQRFDNTPHVTVEETRKKFKLVALIASLVFISGVILIVAGGLTRFSFITGGSICSLAFIVLIVNSVLRWWHHG